MTETRLQLTQRTYCQGFSSKSGFKSVLGQEFPRPPEAETSEKPITETITVDIIPLGSSGRISHSHMVPSTGHISQPYTTPTTSEWEYHVEVQEWHKKFDVPEDRFARMTQCQPIVSGCAQT